MRVLGFLKATAIGGLVFLLPFAFILFLLGQLLQRLLPLFRRVAELLGLPMGESALIALLALSVFLVVACFFAGLFALSRFGLGIRDWIETRVLGRVAVYRMLQSVGDELEGEQGRGIQPALAWTDGWQPAFVVEDLGDGNLTVVLPDAPQATSGTILFLPQSHVFRLDVTVADFLATLRRMGYGSASVLAGKIPPPPAR